MERRQVERDRIGPTPATVLVAGEGPDGIHEKLHRLWLVDPARRWARTAVWRCLSSAGTTDDGDGVLVEAREGTRVVRWDLDGPLQQQDAGIVTDLAQPVCLDRVA